MVHPAEQSDMDGAAPTSDRKHYSIPELLHLRHALPAVTCSVHKLNKHPDIAAIFRIPEEALRRPEKYTCKSKALLALARSHKSAWVERRQAGGRSSIESDIRVSALAVMSENSQNTQWCLRQRDHSDHYAQPYSAPTGLAAQQSENFQRFYRAVVSPTHVRVTAGGRIVPNTRTIAPSEHEWNSEKLLFEPHNPLPSIENQSTSPLVPWHNVPALSSPFPGLSSISSYPQYSFLPQPGIPGFATMGVQGQQAIHVFDSAPYEATQSSQITAESVIAPVHAKQVTASPKQITISPPTQFDHSKPFMYNGQWVYPAPPGFHPPSSNLPVSITMLGNPNFAQQVPVAPTNNFFPTHGLTSLNLNNQPLVMPSNFHPLQMMGPNMQHAPVSAPVPGMVSVSDITRFHIQSLRNNLKFIDNQLANNKHQIDEVYMQTQRQATVAQLDKLETMLQSQLAQENIHIPTALSGGMTTKPDINVAVAPHTQTTDTTVGFGMTANVNDSNLVVAPSKDLAQRPLNVESGFVGMTMDGSQDSKVAVVKPGPSTTRSRLTAAAARAPEFQPRAQILAAASSRAQLSGDKLLIGQGKVTTQSTLESASQIEARLLAKSSDDLDLGAKASSTSVESHATLSKSHNMQTPAVSQASQVPTLQRYNTFHGRSVITLPAIVPPVQTQTLPYLIGVLPRNVHVNEAKATDLVYPRPLTDEELRARHLYWGKAPRSAQSGLPKFDGKDFYPPSPQKGASRLGSSPSSRDPLLQRHSRPASIEFESLFTDPNGLSYSTPSPLRHASSLHSMLPTGVPSLVGTKMRHRENHRKNASFECLKFAMGSSSNITAVPSTPPSRFAAASGNDNPDDFSQLFMERGVPGYKSPSPVQAAQTPLGNFSNKRDGMTGTSDRSGNEFECNLSTGPQKAELETKPTSAGRHATSQGEKITDRNYNESLFAERFANFSSVDQQTQFLQNMLRSTAQTTMAAPALSGAISSATAQGYLPQYRGSAAASLAPAILTLHTSEVEAERPMSKEKSSTHPATAFSPLVVSSYLPENRPLNRDRATRTFHPLLENMNAESYMRSLSRKADDEQKARDQELKSETAGTGPIIGSNW